MFLMFGISDKEHLIGEYHYYCYGCNMNSIYLGVIKKKAFTFFFIPILPLGEFIFLRCSRCGHIHSVKKFPEEDPLKGQNDAPMFGAP